LNQTIGGAVNRRSGFIHQKDLKTEARTKEYDQQEREAEETENIDLRVFEKSTSDADELTLSY
jgi:hypothetical protein